MYFSDRLFLIQAEEGRKKKERIIIYLKETNPSKTDLATFGNTQCIFYCFILWKVVLCVMTTMRLFNASELLCEFVDSPVRKHYKVQLPR